MAIDRGYYQRLIEEAERAKASYDQLQGASAADRGEANTDTENWARGFLDPLDVFGFQGEARSRRAAAHARKIREAERGAALGTIGQGMLLLEEQDPSKYLISDEEAIGLQQLALDQLMEMGTSGGYTNAERQMMQVAARDMGDAYAAQRAGLAAQAEREGVGAGLAGIAATLGAVGGEQRAFADRAARINAMGQERALQALAYGQQGASQKRRDAWGEAQDRWNANWQKTQAQLGQMADERAIYTKGWGQGFQEYMAARARQNQVADQQQQTGKQIVSSVAGGLGGMGGGGMGGGPPTSGGGSVVGSGGGGFSNQRELDDGSIYRWG